MTDHAATEPFIAVETSTTDTPTAADSVRGRSCFCIETTGVGLAVHTVFAAEDGRMLPMPAVFPDVHYALEQIDALRSLVVERFAQAARVGAQVIAEQRARAATLPAATPLPAAAETPALAEPAAELSAAC